MFVAVATKLAIARALRRLVLGVAPIVGINPVGSCPPRRGVKCLSILNTRLNLKGVKRGPLEAPGDVRRPIQVQCDERRLFRPEPGYSGEQSHGRRMRPFVDHAIRRRVATLSTGPRSTRERRTRGDNAQQSITQSWSVIRIPQSSSVERGA